MTSRKGREGIRAELPKETKQALKEADEPMWKLIDNAVRMSMGVGDADTEQAFRRRIDRIEQELANVQDEIAALNKKRERLEQDLEDEQSRLEQYLAERDSIETLQDEILDDLASSSVSVYAHRSTLRDLARREYGHETTANIQKAITDLKERRTERALDISDAQFSENVNSQATGTADGGTEFKATSGDDDD